MVIRILALRNSRTPDELVDIPLREAAAFDIIGGFFLSLEVLTYTVFVPVSVSAAAAEAVVVDTNIEFCVSWLSLDEDTSSNTGGT